MKDQTNHRLARARRMMQNALVRMDVRPLDLDAMQTEVAAALAALEACDAPGGEAEPAAAGGM